MPRQTKAARLAALAEFQAEQEAERLKFKAEFNRHLWELNVLANKAGLRTVVTLTEFGPQLQIDFEEHDAEVFSVSKTEQWEMENAKARVQREIDEALAKETRRQLARDTLAELSPEKLAALREFKAYI
jgi:hypothetical protein